MSLSVLDLYTIGTGPSSSHTVGPMRAGQRFVARLIEAGLLEQTARVEAHLYGSLALTGKGHGTDKAVLLGLEGETPEVIDVDAVPAKIEAIRTHQRLKLGGTHEVPFHEKDGLLFHRLESLPEHPNGMRFIARGADGTELLNRVYYSIGGGFVVNEETAKRDELSAHPRILTHPFRNGDDLLRLGRETGLRVSELTLRNESAWRPEADTRVALLRVWKAMQDCVGRGCHREGTLPGGLKVERRASKIYRELSASPEAGLRDPLTVLDWV
ncbi:MAG TPA: L-serine ammonia-lyase, partial [Verrucomicrobiales bacterium]|nr:L-serine ammonia-lyase [Verrucomicrobiales bacterium]